MTISDGCSESFAMLVNKAYYTTNNITHGLYIDVLKFGYKLGNVTLPPLSKFDEITAYTAYDENAVLSGGYGVVSVNMNENRTTQETNIKQTGTYQNQLTDVDKGKYANPTARYYYNLDVCDSSDAAQNILLWSVNKYVAPNIQKNEFISTISNNTLTGEADMTGLSFYPIAMADGVIINNLTLTLDYNGIYSTAENTGNTDNYNRDPGAKNQHYLIHSGLFLNSTAGSTLTINGALSLNGNFLELDNYSGVLINNTMSGSLICKDGSISLNGIVAKTTGGAEYSDGYLLIHNLNRANDTVAVPKLQLYNVSTGEGYTAGEHFKSLIGQASGPGLEIEFSKIKLDARKTASTADDAMSTAYHTTKSIFKHSTLLDSIKTDNNAKLTYNYTYDDDWLNNSRNVTYGYEISGSVEYAERERKYSSCSGDDKKRYYTNPESAPDSLSMAYNFENYLKYVYNNNENFTGTSDSNGYYYRELKVNVETDGLTEGCGTYNDPYIINSAAQFTVIAAFLRDSSNPKVLGDVCLPNTKPTLFESGNRWCSNKESHAIYTAGDSTFDKPSDTSAEWNNNNIQRYLASAYYKITNDITLDGTYYGLGGTTANTSFRGVIVGDTKSDGSPKYTITNPTDNPFIMVSNGCVIKDLNITIAKQDITKTQANNTYSNAYFGYNHTEGNVCKFYGGIIGEVMGGDNIIDNSYVTFDESSKITLSGANGTIIPVGGYVCVVVFGGVIFKNMDSRKTTIESTNLNVVYTEHTYNLAYNSNQEAWATIYVNPIVGRVINGYAVNETGGNALDTNGNKVQQFSQSEDGTYHDEDGTTRANVKQHTLKNGKKHYSIADIDPELEKLDVESIPLNASTDGVINIPNSQAFFILSLITQSTSGTATTATGGYVKSLSYGTNDDNVYGMSHNADYSNVGTATANTDSDYMLASEDTASNTAVPYIISRFTKKTDDIINTITETIYSTYTGDVAGLDGKTFRIYNTDEGNTKYFGNTIIDNNPSKLKNTADKSLATLWTFESSSSGYYIYTDIDNVITYMCMDGSNGNMSLTSNKENATLFTITNDNNKFIFKNGSRYVNKFGGGNSTGFAGWKENNYGSKHVLEQQIIAECGYNARCVASTLGYYDINLESGETYQLPDSFRGLGSVGYYDDAGGISNKFCIKLDVLNGNNCTIDEDIYLNKYYTDNYFNTFHKNSTVTQDINSNVSGDFNKETVNSGKTFHGIGLFDSVIMKDSISSISKMTLSGSLNTDIYSNNYSSTKEDQEVKNYNDLKSLFLSCGGVVGWSTDTQWCNFTNVDLNHLSIRESCFVAGILGYSGNNSTSVYVTVQECDVNDLALCLTAASQVDTADKNKRRFDMVAYVGKVFQGGGLVYGTNKKDKNTDLNNFATVKLSNVSSTEKISQ